MNTRTKKPSTLRAARGGAGLARTGALLALALGAAQAGATTYTVPLQFNITLTAPVCSLTVGGQTVTTTGATSTTTGSSPIVNLTPLVQPLVTAAPRDIVAAMTGLTTYTADAAGLSFPATSHTFISRYVTTPPTAKALCTAGTPMTASVSKISLATSTPILNSNYMAGTSSDAAQTATLPIGMLMGIAKFGTSNGVSGLSGVTWGSTVPTVSATATGSDQDILLTASVHGPTSTVALSSSMAGQWTYKFNVNLDF